MSRSSSSVVCYAAFGGLLETPVPLTVLRQAPPGEPTWRLRATPAVHSEPFVGEYLGEATVQKEIRVRLYCGEAGFSLQYDDTGRFDISADGAEITWYAPPDAAIEKAELDISGRVLATALYASGTLCLHGSGVVISGEGIAFLAPKFHGKSTFAHTLVAAGARLVTDDVLAVEPGPPTIMRPGVQRIRLWSDAAARLASEWVPVGQTADAKHLIDAFDEERLLLETAPLNAIYLLSPVRPGQQSQAAERQLVPVMQAGLSVLKNATLGALLGRSEATRLLHRSYAIAEHVPVYTLRYVRDFERIGEVVERILEWHGPRRAAPAGPA